MYKISSLTATVVFALLLNCNYAFAMSGNQDTPIVNRTIADIAKKTIPSVVSVNVLHGDSNENIFIPRERKPSPQPPQGERPKVASGTGFFVDDIGHIITNNHVVEGAKKITVILGEDKEYSAEIIGRDAKFDIALLKIKPKDGESFPFLTIGDSELLEVGEWVVAVGNPFGLSHSVTHGIISAKDRVIGGRFDEFLQTDAAINPGNSGGPLLDLKGEVIGVNTAIISGEQGGSVGVGFAIPINTVKSVYKQLKENGKVTRGLLGVMIQKRTPQIDTSFGLKESDYGVLVSDVIKGGAADKGGIKRGDLITHFNGYSIKSLKDLPKVVAATPPNTVVSIVITRNGKKETFSVTVGTMLDTPEPQQNANPEGFPGMTPDEPPSVEKPEKQSFRGMILQDLTPGLAGAFKFPGTEGVIVSEVKVGSVATVMKNGDVIVEVNKQKVVNVEDFYSIIKDVKDKDAVLLYVFRNGMQIYVPLPAESK